MSCLCLKSSAERAMPRTCPSEAKPDWPPAGKRLRILRDRDHSPTPLPQYAHVAVQKAFATDLLRPLYSANAPSELMDAMLEESTAASWA